MSTATTTRNLLTRRLKIGGVGKKRRKGTIGKNKKNKLVVQKNVLRNKGKMCLKVRIEKIRGSKEEKRKERKI